MKVDSIHALKIDTCSNSRLDEHLKRFWDLESLGIKPEEESVHHKFVQQI